MLRFKWKLFFGFLVSGVIVVCLNAALLVGHVSFQARATGATAASSVVRTAADALLGEVFDHWYMVLALAVLTSAPPALFVAWRLNRPIRLLSDAIARVEDGDLHTIVAKPRTSDEFEPLIDHFNAMVAGLRETRELKEALALRDQVEQALREAGERLETRVRQRTTELERTVRERDRFVAHSPDLVAEATLTGQFTRVNPAFERVLGYTPAEITAAPFITFVHPDDVQPTLREVRRLSTGLPTVHFENRYRCKDGSHKCLQWTAIPVLDEGVIYAIGRDMTDRQRADVAEQALLEASMQMRIAKEIQISVLPETGIRMNGFDVAGASRPFASVGGDYYDFIPTADTQLTLAIADASGHGLSAALVVAQLQACLWALMVADPHPIDEVLERANALLYARTPANCYATALLVRVDGARRALWYANGGHPPGFVLDSGGAIKSRLESGGHPLGCFASCGAGTSLPQTLDVGDVVVLTTDGILEAASDADEPFGEERLLAAVRERLHESAQQIAEAVQEAVAAFSGGAQDDATLVVMKVAG
jgi:PAS domain S-box-containing protein